MQTPLVAACLFLAVCPLPALLSCTKGQAAQCRDAASAPGSNLAGEGFDVVTMERKQAFVVDMNKWRREDGSCTLCVNPFMEGGQQRLPVAVADWRPSQKCHMSLSSTLYESSESFVAESQTEVDSSWKVGLDLVTPNVKGSVMLGGTHSRAAKKAMDQSKRDKYNFIMQEVHCSNYGYRLTEDPPLHSDFIRSVQKLPPLYTNNTKVDYKQFLSIFGTHYIQKVRLGGRVKSVTSVRVCQMALDGYKMEEVKDCLESEVSVGTATGTVEGSAKLNFCKNELKKRDSKESFSQTYKERFNEVTGGQIDGTQDLLFSAKIDPAAFGNWMNTLKTSPDIISYSLGPVYRLINHPQKRQGVKKATEDYVMENALIARCSDKCPQGSTSSLHDACSCVCPSTNQMTSTCCPTERGLAHLTVKIKHATGLWGDYRGPTDGFVKVMIGSAAAQTRVIHNNDNPQWNEELYLGTIKISPDSELKFETWDEDKAWYDSTNDLLGSCVKQVREGTHDLMCPMNHGSIFFWYKIACAPGLGGPTCGEHVPSKMSADLWDLYASRNSLNMTTELLAQLRMGNSVEDPLTFMMQQRGNRSEASSSPACGGVKRSPSYQ